MFGLRNLLFGKKVTVNTQIGTFTARVKNNNSKEITWTRDSISKTDTTELFLLLTGNAKGPYESQIETVQFILNNQEEVKAQILDFITSNTTLQLEFKDQNIVDFHLVAINPWLKSEISLELSYETKNEEGYIGAIFKNQKITEVYF